MWRGVRFVRVHAMRSANTREERVVLWAFGLFLCSLSAFMAWFSVVSP